MFGQVSSDPCHWGRCTDEKVKSLGVVWAQRLDLKYADGNWRSALDLKSPEDDAMPEHIEYVDTSRIKSLNRTSNDDH